MAAIMVCVFALVASMGARNGQDDVESLLARARSSDKAVRLEALAALGQLGPRAGQAVPELCRMLQDPSVREDPFTLSAIAEVLAEVGAKAKPAIPLLQGVARDRKVDSASQGTAMIAIDRIWLADPDPELRLRGARGLGMSSPVALPALRRAQADPDPRVRDAVQAAIKRLEAANSK